MYILCIFLALYEACYTEYLNAFRQIQVSQAIFNIEHRNLNNKISIYKRLDNILDCGYFPYAKVAVSSREGRTECWHEYKTLRKHYINIKK